MERKDDVSPIEVSPNKISWIWRPLYYLSLGLIIPDQCVPILDHLKELVVTRQFGICYVTKLTGESGTKWIRVPHGPRGCETEWIRVPNKLTVLGPDRSHLISWPIPTKCYPHQSFRQFSNGPILTKWITVLHGPHVRETDGSEFRISSRCSDLIALTWFRDLSQQNVIPINHSDSLVMA